jgi:hypothetical protein
MDLIIIVLVMTLEGNCFLAWLVSTKINKSCLPMDGLKIEVIMMNIKELLEAIRKRPGMYVRVVNFDSVIEFIDNFLATKRICRINDEVDDIFSQNFPSWVCEHFGVNKRFLNRWEYVIYINSSSDENALEIFFSLSNNFFENFKNQYKN